MREVPNRFQSIKICGKKTPVLMVIQPFSKHKILSHHPSKTHGFRCYLLFSHPTWRQGIFAFAMAFKGLSEGRPLLQSNKTPGHQPNYRHSSNKGCRLKRPQDIGGQSPVFYRNTQFLVGFLSGAVGLRGTVGAMRTQRRCHNWRG